MGGEGERRRRQRGEGVAKDSKRLAMLQAIGVVAGGEFCEAGETVGDTFDGAKPHRACADGGQKCGEHSCSGFVAPVA